MAHTSLNSGLYNVDSDHLWGSCGEVSVVNRSRFAFTTKGCQNEITGWDIIRYGVITKARK